MISINVSGKNYQLDAPPEVPLLWVLREQLQLTGTKYSCGIGECGSCTVRIDGQAERACTIPIEDVNGAKIVTIEGLAENHPVKRAWVLEQVPQCGIQCRRCSYQALAHDTDKRPGSDKKCLR